MGNSEEFLQQFNFDPTRNLMVGVERECHLTNKEGEILPLARKVLSHLGYSNNNDGVFGYELSACQLEWRVGPCLISELRDKLLEREAVLQQAEEEIGFARSFVETAPDTIPLVVSPDPTGRYQRIARDLPKNVLLAACQVIGTHIHIGMPNPQTALKVYNSVIKNCEELSQLGDHSSGKRLEIYKIMAPKYFPPHCNSWQDFYELSVKDGFTKYPRNCWYLIRISIHGTIEFRMFGATADLEEVISWANICRNLCQKAER